MYIIFVSSFLSFFFPLWNNPHFFFISSFFYFFLAEYKHKKTFLWTKYILLGTYFKHKRISYKILSSSVFVKLTQKMSFPGDTFYTRIINVSFFSLLCKIKLNLSKKWHMILSKKLKIYYFLLFVLNDDLQIKFCKYL